MLGSDFDSGPTPMDVDVDENETANDSQFANLDSIHSLEYQNDRQSDSPLSQGDLSANIQQSKTGLEDTDFIVCEDFDAEDLDDDWSEDINPDFDDQTFFKQGREFNDVETVRDGGRNL